MLALPDVTRGIRGLAVQHPREAHKVSRGSDWYSEVCSTAPTRGTEGVSCLRNPIVGDSEFQLPERSLENPTLVFDASQDCLKLRFSTPATSEIE